VIAVVIKNRIIPILLLQDGLLKKRINFLPEKTRTIANPVTIARVFEARKTDELILLDIGRTIDKGDIDSKLITQIAEELHMPFSYGGGIDSIEKMTEVITHGAEKVVLNTAAIENKILITKGAEKFGSQCIVVSIDVVKKGNGSYEVVTKSGSKLTGLNPIIFAKEVEKLGAGEILVNAIHKEGTMEGMDLELIKSITKAVKIPVIATGGVGKEEDFIAGIIEGGASAVAAGSIFHYTHITPNMVKEKMREAGIPVRIQDPKSCY